MVVGDLGNWSELDTTIDIAVLGCLSSSSSNAKISCILVAFAILEDMASYSMVAVSFFSSLLAFTSDIFLLSLIASD
jgi:hypothetical protein